MSSGGTGRTVIGVVLIVLAAAFLLRGIAYVFTDPSPATLVGFVVGGLVLAAGVVTLRRGLAGRRPS